MHIQSYETLRIVQVGLFDVLHDLESPRPFSCMELGSKMDGFWDSTQRREQTSNIQI